MKKANVSVNLFWTGLITLASVLFESTKVTTAQLSKTSAIQAGATYTLTIKDENGEGIGQYFDIRIDSFRVQGDTTVNFQMIPNLGIQDSSLQERYSTFLEMLRRNTVNEVEAVVHSEKAVGTVDDILQRWDTPSFDFGSYKYEGFNYDQQFRDIGQEINLLTGVSIVREGGSSAIEVDYSSREPSKIVVTRFSDLGIPSQGVLYKKSFALNANELDRDIRLAYLRTLLLNNDVDEDLLNEDGSFTSDALNILKTAYTLENLRNLSCDENEENRSPVAITRVNASFFLTGEPITLIGSDSKDPDGSIKTYSWSQVHGGPKTLDYITDNEGLLTNPDSSVAQFTADWPGVYRYQLEVEDDRGCVNRHYEDVSVDRRSERKMDFRGLIFFDSFTFVKMNYDATFERLKNDNINYIGQNWLITLHKANPLPVLSDSMATPREEVEKLVSYTKRYDISFFLNVQWYPESDSLFEGLGDVHGSEWWDSFFTQYRTLLIDWAAFAERLGVAMLNVQWLDLANSLDPRQNATTRWIDLIEELRSVYKGLITFSIGIGGTYQQPWNVLQYSESLVEHLDVVLLYIHSQLGPTSELPLNLLMANTEGVFSNRGAVYPNESLDEIGLRIGKPIILATAYNSAFNQNNYLFFESSNDNPDVQTDFANQVRIFEALFEAIRHRQYISGFFPWGYHLHDSWYVDPNDHHGSFDRSPNIRNKPAEEAMKLWFNILKPTRE